MSILHKSRTAETGKRRQADGGGSFRSRGMGWDTGPANQRSKMGSRCKGGLRIVGGENGWTLWDLDIWMDSGI